MLYAAHSGILIDIQFIRNIPPANASSGNRQAADESVLFCGSQVAARGFSVEILIEALGVSGEDTAIGLFASEPQSPHSQRSEPPNGGNHRGALPSFLRSCDRDTFAVISFDGRLILRDDTAMVQVPIEGFKPSSEMRLALFIESCGFGGIERELIIAINGQRCGRSVSDTSNLDYNWSLLL